MDLEEFHQALEDLEIHLTPKEFRKLVAETDDEGEGKIELDEFKACAVRDSNALGFGACGMLRLDVAEATLRVWGLRNAPFGRG